MSTSHGRKATGKSKRSNSLTRVIEEISTLSRAKPSSLNTLHTVLQRMQTILGADAISIYQYDPVHEHLNELANVGGKVELVGFLAIGEGKGLTGWAALNTRPLLLKNRTSNVSFDPDRDYASFMAAPLPMDSAPYGLVAVGCKQANGFALKDSDALLELVDPLSIALERFLFCKRLESATREIDRLNRQFSDSAAQIAAGRELGSLATRMIALNHEVNEALSVIIGHLQCLAADRVMTNQKELSRLRRMEEAALRIRSVNQTLIRLARAGQMKQPTLVNK